jgi:transposase-like protein
MITGVPKTFVDFQRLFSTEEACREHLAQWRWPKGFWCPRCAHDGCSRLSRRALYQCNRCKHQVSITSGTVMHRSKLPLRTWFWAIFLVGRDKKGVSAVQLQRDIGVGSYRTAWLLLHKIRSSFDEKPEEFPLRGVVEVDEAYIGRVAQGEHGGRGSSAARVVAAVERTPEGPLGSVRLAVVDAVSSRNLTRFITREVDKAHAIVRTDGFQSYKDLKCLGFKHERQVSARPIGRGRPVLPGVHLVFSNLKTWLRGRFHGVSPKYLPAYLAEFAYRFNRRHDPFWLFGWVTRRLMHRPPRTLAQLRAG